jgi:hypothetical protein
MENDYGRTRRAVLAGAGAAGLAMAAVHPSGASRPEIHGGVPIGEPMTRKLDLSYLDV